MSSISASHRWCLRTSATSPRSSRRRPLLRASRRAKPMCTNTRPGACSRWPALAGKLGAALLVGHAALRAGAGLCTIASWPDAVAAAGVACARAHDRSHRSRRTWRARSIARSSASARVVIGPGFGTDAAAEASRRARGSHWEGVKVLDADALTLFAGRPEALASRAATSSSRLIPARRGAWSVRRGQKSRVIARGRSRARRSRKSHRRAEGRAHHRRRLGRAISSTPPATPPSPRRARATFSRESLPRSRA